MPSISNVLSRVDKFLAEAVKKPPSVRGSLVFALDATMSRQPTWDMAVHLQAEMFKEVANLGALDIKMIYFRGDPAAGNAECKTSQWMNSTAQVAAYMTGITCRGGLTQIARTFDHILQESAQRKINAVISVGDCCEEPRVNLVPLARRLADQNIPIFLFQEGPDPEAEMMFRELAQITHGAHLRFDQGSARQLGELLRAIATFTVGGVTALEKQGSEAAKLLLRQVR